jgi:hypothetical protein
MNAKMFRILELCLALKEQKGYDVFFQYSPHVHLLRVFYWEGLTFNGGKDYAYHSNTYLDDRLGAEKKLDAIIKHLESL